MTLLKKLFPYFKIAAGAAIIIIAVRNITFSEVAAVLKSADLNFVLLAFLCGVLQFALISFRLKTTLSVLKQAQLSEIAGILLKSKAYAYIVPGSLGYDISSIMHLKMSLNDRLSIAVIFYLDKIIGAFALFAGMGIFYPFAAPLMPEVIRVMVLSVVVFGAIGCAVAVLFAFWCGRGQLRGDIKGGFKDRVLYLARTFNEHKAVYAKVFAIGTAANIIMQSGGYFLLRAVHLPIDYSYAQAVFPLNSFVLLLPLTIGGIGLREGGFFYLLKPYGISFNNVVAFNLIGYVFEFVFVCAGVLLILNGTRIRETAND